MKLLYRVWLLLLLLASNAQAMDVVGQYHVWYDRPASCPAANPTTAWSHWDHNFGDFTNRNPCNFVGGTTWLRDTSHVIYPLIGPYDSDNAEVMRWHIKVAKAAGYTAFLVSVFPGVTFDHATVRARFLTMLQVASEEDFKLGMELWFPLDTSNATYYSHAQGTIDAANASPHASASFGNYSLSPAVLDAAY